MERVADHGRMLSLEYAELNPVYDIRNQSAEVGVELLLSALGKRIL
jgi:arginase